jgi:hypothetical protein
MAKTTEIHVVEKQNDQFGNRVFEGYARGGQNLLTAGLEQGFAMGSKQAIAWCCEIERQMFAHGYTCQRIYENF